MPVRDLAVVSFCSFYLLLVLRRSVRLVSPAR